MGDLAPWLDEVEDVVLVLMPEQALTAAGTRSGTETDLEGILGHIPGNVKRLTAVLQHSVPIDRDKVAPIEEYARDLLRQSEGGGAWCRGSA